MTQSPSNQPERQGKAPSQPTSQAASPAASQTATQTAIQAAAQLAACNDDALSRALGQALSSQQIPEAQEVAQRLADALANSLSKSPNESPNESLNHSLAESLNESDSFTESLTDALPDHLTQAFNTVEPAPTGLAERIAHQTQNAIAQRAENRQTPWPDTALSSLLDQALAPSHTQACSDLAQRIVDATTPQLTAARPQSGQALKLAGESLLAAESAPSGFSGVLAQIGGPSTTSALGSRLLLAAASALIVITAGFVAVIATLDHSNPSKPIVSVDPQTNPQPGPHSDPQLPSLPSNTDSSKNQTTTELVDDTAVQIALVELDDISFDLPVSASIAPSTLASQMTALETETLWDSSTDAADNAVLIQDLAQAQTTGWSVF